MAVVTYVKVKNQSSAAMYGVINYCTRENKVRDVQSGKRIVSGINCNGENAFREFMTTKAAHNKMDGTFYYHYVQSFSGKEGITHNEAHEIAKEFAGQSWPGHEILIATHLDTKNPHSHIVINSVNFENGRKLRQDTHTLMRLRETSDRICMNHGYSIITKPQKHTSYTPRGEYRAAVNNKSWKFALMRNIDQAMKKSGTRAEFVKEMNRSGYDMTWTDTRKSITFICPNGCKCRDLKLHEEKYLKENLEKEFKLREQLSNQPHMDKTASQKSVKDDRWVIFGDEPKPETKRETIIEDATGWEKERGIYYRDIPDAELEDIRVGEFERRTGESHGENNYHSGNEFGEIVGTAIHGVAAISDMIDSGSDDEEERKKEQEAKLSGGNLGALVGIGAGIISALVQKDEPDEELVQEQEEIDEIIEDEIEDEEYIDFMMGM